MLWTLSVATCGLLESSLTARQYKNEKKSGIFCTHEPYRMHYICRVSWQRNLHNNLQQMKVPVCQLSLDLAKLNNYIIIMQTGVTAVSEVTRGWISLHQSLV